jgi:hypothetical protein
MEKGSDDRKTIDSKKSQLYNNIEAMFNVDQKRPVK